MIPQSLMAKIRNDLDRWETPILWMYLDSGGLVTVGCGVMLPDAASAKAIGFFHEKTLKPASGLEIEAAWKHLHLGAAKQRTAPPEKKLSARHYRTESDLRITLHVSSSLRDRHVQEDYRHLKQIYVGFDSFPDNAKLELFDMIYNLGPGRHKARQHRATGLRNYALMNSAIDKAEWSLAAARCRRHGIPADRNHMTAALLRSCEAKATKDGAGVHGR